MSIPKVHALAEPLARRGRAIAPSMVVLHATGGRDVEGAIETLRDRGLSYHYLIAPDGAIWKGCPADAVAFHAGNSYGPREAMSGVSRAQNGVHEFTARPTPCVNDYSLGIAFVNLDDGRDPYEAAQVESAKWLVGQLRGQFPGLTHLSSHAIVSPGRKVDPLGFDLDGFGRAVGLRVWRP